MAAPRILPRRTRDFDQAYDSHYVLARGTHADVWLCSPATQVQEQGPGIGPGPCLGPGVGGEGESNELAAKVVRKWKLKPSAIENLKSEVAVHSELSGKHPNIVRLETVLESEKTLTLVMELCRGGDLFDLLEARGKLPDAAAKGLFRQVVSAVGFCHDQGIVHRDIKPENILLDRDAACLYRLSPQDLAQEPVKAKLADFGLALSLGKAVSVHGYVGSRFYTAPELIRNRSGDSKADMWSLGIVLHIMLTGKLPFSGESLPATQESILRGRIPFLDPCWDGSAKEARDLVSKLLDQDPTSRLSAREALSHPWLSESRASLDRGSYSAAVHYERQGSVASVRSEFSGFTESSAETETIIYGRLDTYRPGTELLETRSLGQQEPKSTRKLQYLSSLTRRFGRWRLASRPKSRQGAGHLP